jgi:SPP1 gp7 family putative phage head morphogenesis protein
MLHREMRTVREWIIGNKKSPKAVFEKLESVRKQIVEIKYRDIKKAEEQLRQHAAALASVVSQYEGERLTVIANERDIRRRTLKSSLSDDEIKDMLNYKPFVDGKSIGQWFEDLKYDHASRIFNSVQKGVVEGYTLNTIIQAIQGKPTEHGWEPGILDRNRKTAEMLARTVINATANQSRLEMYRDNADVIDGVKWTTAFDHRTCMICAAYSGKIWKPDQLDTVKVPPAHPNCRCVLIPYIDIGEEGTSPAEAENFDLLAKEKHEADFKEGKTKKKYDDLSYEYRRKLRYKAIEDYHKEHGENSSYKQIPSGSTFSDYFAGQSDKFQEEWLGKTRYEMYKSGRLPIERMHDPDKGFKLTIDDLEEELAKLDHGIRVNGVTIIVEKNRSDTDIVEPTGEALEYIRNNTERDRKYSVSLEKIDKKLQDIKIKMADEERNVRAMSGKEWSDEERKKQFDKATENLQKEYNDIQTKHAKETITALFGEPVENKTFDFVYQKMDEMASKKQPAKDRKAVQETVDDAVKYVQGILDSIGIKYSDKQSLRVFTQDKDRGSFWGRGKIGIDLRERSGLPDMPLGCDPFTSTIHELIHDVVQTNPKLRQRLQEFVNEHNPQPAKLQDNDKLLYLKLDIPMPSFYCTYIQQDGAYPEELLTMFFTCLLSDTSIRSDMNATIRTGTDFASQYPDYFNGIMNILRGLKK